MLGVLFCLLVIFEVNCLKEINYDKDGDLSLDDLVWKYGSVGISYYDLTLSDGYIIKVFRLDQKNATNMKPILLLHGLTVCADSFFVDKGQSLPFFLMKEGYDIWMINNRGTVHSTGHVTLNSETDKEYWHFSWQEIGMIDMTATIDLVLANNIHDKVALVGQSQGSFEIFAGLSEVPKYNEKVAISFHFGGAVYHSGCHHHILAIGCKYNKFLEDLLDAIGVHKLWLSNNMKETLLTMSRLDAFNEIMKEFLGNISITDPKNFNNNLTDVSYVISRAICGGGMRELLHYGQIGQSGIFARYDYGTAKNLRIYNSTKPPRFHLERITSPTAIFCGKRDMFCWETDVRRAKNEIPNVVYAKMIPNFGHVDFIQSKQFKRYIYRDMMDLLKKYLV